jgi:DSF synthase
MNQLALLNGLQPESEAEKGFPLIKTHYDEKYRVSWCYMQSSERPCFTPTLLKSLMSYVRQLQLDMVNSDGQKFDYMVLASSVDGVFNLGGDLELFRRCILEQDREELERYALACIDVLYEYMIHFSVDVTTISLVQGDALGGGFETALGAHVIIAEKGVKMGFPEALFNLFPGMGAFSILSRKMGAHAAEEMMLSGKLHDAEELYEMGLVNILAEPGEGENEVYRFIQKRNRQHNSYRALRKVRDRCNDYSYQEMKDIVDIWVDAAFQLDSRDLRMMERLVKRQDQIA